MFWFNHQPNPANGRQTTVSTSSRQHGCIIDSRNPRRENIWFEAVRVQQIVLEELTRLIGFCVSLHGQDTVWPSRKSYELVLQRIRQVENIATVADGCHFGGGIWIRVTWRWWVVRGSYTRRLPR